MKGGLGCGGIGCLVIVAAVVIAVVVGMNSNSEEREAERQEGLAAIACQDVVRDNLRSPSTADFVGFPEVNGSIITGQVDAQNGFGATVRSSFQCTIVSPERVRLDFIE